MFPGPTARTSGKKTGEKRPPLPCIDPPPPGAVPEREDLQSLLIDASRCSKPSEITDVGGTLGTGKVRRDSQVPSEITG